jgi:hypothetical protein
MRRRVRKRILLWSIGAGSIAALLLAVAFVLLEIVPNYLRLGEANQETLKRIPCTDGGPTSGPIVERRRCDVSEIMNDPEFDSSDYVLTRDSYYFVLQTARYPGFWLNYSDPVFIRAFRQPTSVIMPNGALMRLYSQAARAGDQSFEVMVGRMEEAPWTDVKAPAEPKVDEFLLAEAARIASGLAGKGERHRVGKPSSKLDVLEIVDSETGRVIRWYEDVPGKLPPGEYLARGPRLHWREGDLFLVRTDSNDDLIAVSLASVVDVWWLTIAFVSTFLAVCGLFYAVCSTWFRRYFVVFGRPRITVRDALNRGEGQEIEFKQDAQDRRALVKAVAGFANTNDGTIFVGVDDRGRIEGISAKTLEEKDKWRQAVLNALREAIRPAPVVDLEFEEADGTLVAKLFVPRGEEPLYSRGGVVYVRKDAETIPADPPDIIRIVEQFAF